MAGWRVVGIVLGVAAAWAPGGPARAQKNTGPLLPPPSAGYAAPEAGAGLSHGDAVARPPAARPVLPAAVGVPRPLPLPPGPGGQNPEATRLAETLPLDPQTRDLRDRVPTDPQEIERRLGLREPTGPVADLRGRTPSVREIIDALRPR